jgi:two-component system LytT family response regulator
MRALIVDDEPLGRQRIRTLLAREADVEVLRECEDGAEAVAAIRALRPDVVFLDVQMPEMDGFQVLEALGRELPEVVFVTAYDHYAVRAFEAAAVDYLVKPFDPERFQVTLARVRSRLADAAPAGDELRALLRRLAGGDETRAERIAVRTGTRHRLVPVADIDWVEAQDNYVALHVGKQRHLLREGMTSLMRRLDPRRFVRIHRGTIVNVERIATVETWGQFEFLVTLLDGTKLTSSRGYRDEVKRLLGR